MTTLPTGPPRSRWPRVAMAIGVLIAMVVAAVLVTNLVGEPKKNTTPTATASTTAPAEVMPAPGANGCLGGVDPNKAVLIAQQQAPLTAKGAAEFLATVMRWGAQYPPDANYADTVRKVTDPGADPRVFDPPKSDAGPNDANWLTTLDGKYLVREVSTTGATVDIVLVGYSRVSGTQTTLSFAGRIDLSIVDGHWRQRSSVRLDDTDKAKVETTGSTYVGGC